MDQTRRRLPPLVSDLAGVFGLMGLTLLVLLALAYDTALAKAMLSLEMNDFGKFYYSARHFLEGVDLYAIGPATMVPMSDLEWLRLENMNPPHFHLLILPFSLWGPRVALAGWTIASVTSLTLAARLVINDLGRPMITRWRLAFLVFVFVAWVGTGSLIVTGQLSWILLWPLTMSWSAMRRGHWLKSGMLVGLLASVKPFLGVLFVYFVIRRQYRAAVAGLLALASAFLMGLAVFGIAAHVSWIRALRGIDWSWLAMNGSLLGFVTRVFSRSPQLVPLAAQPDVIIPLWLVAAALGLAVTLVAVVRRRCEVDRAFLLLLVASLLFSPLGWVYYAWFLIPPLVAICGQGLFHRQRAWLIPALVAGLWPVPLTVIGQPSALATITLGSIYFWGFLSLWTAVLRDSPRPAVGALPAAAAGGLCSC